MVRDPFKKVLADVVHPVFVRLAFKWPRPHFPDFFLESRIGFPWDVLPTVAATSCITKEKRTRASREAHRPRA